MNPDMLAQLRDIHAAPTVPWWPPAPGWWVLVLLLLAALVWLGSGVLAQYKLRQRRKQMLAWVDTLNSTLDPQLEPQAWLSMINRIFKLVALRAFPGQQVEAMHGNAWPEFLRDQMKASKANAALVALASGPYDPAPHFDPVVISDLARSWIKQHG